MSKEIKIRVIKEFETANSGEYLQLYKEFIIDIVPTVGVKIFISEDEKDDSFICKKVEYHMFKGLYIIYDERRVDYFDKCDFGGIVKRFRKKGWELAYCSDLLEVLR